MAIIRQTPMFSSLMLTARTVDDAMRLYANASMIPRTETRAFVKQLGFVLDGDMAVPGQSRAIFFHAFKRTVPYVFKVLTGGTSAKDECALWNDVSKSVTSTEFLVPVEYVKLSPGTAKRLVYTGHESIERTDLKEGILMPAYAGTIARFPPPLYDLDATVLVNRIEPTLRFLHDKGWMHGDVKPSNIFLDYAGVTWLGDYGSSVRVEEVDKFRGGTPAFQCDSLFASDGPLLFDLTGLAISVLVLLGLLSADAAPQAGWPLEALHAAGARIDSDALRRCIAGFLPPLPVTAPAVES
jgi:serine/threonine protein kinase